jgi:OOP family OmpA-OmpF porin
MKHFNKFLLAAVVLSSVVVQAQNSNNPYAISFGVSAMHTRENTKAPLSGKWFETQTDQALAVNRNWNILPTVSYIGVSRTFAKNLSVELQGTVSRLSKFVYTDTKSPLADQYGLRTINPGNLMMYGLDLNVHYSFMDMLKSKTFEPFVTAGAGLSALDNFTYGSVNLGAGMTFWFSEFIGLDIKSFYKGASLVGNNKGIPSSPQTPLAPSHFIHMVGLKFQFGGKDTDGDGVYDKYDACPDVAGLAKFNGCPDTDGDGIVDGSDSCPTEFGTALMNGCPDKDNDGVADKDDACPDKAGVIALKGCPDSDKDGIADKDDKCPTVAGTKANGGCPAVVDTDGDGVPDNVDADPLKFGPASNNGKPLTIVASPVAFKSTIVYFDDNKSSFKQNDSQTMMELDMIKEALRKDASLKISVEGYTDSDGSYLYNQILSSERVKTVKNYLSGDGINPKNVTTKTFGEKKPWTTNKTEEGKVLNRRVEVKKLQ